MPAKFVENLNVMFASFLETKPEFQRTTRLFYHHNPINVEPIEDLRKRKIMVNKEAKKANATEEVKLEAKSLIRLHSHMLKVKKKKNGS